jgi:hypothetical protein
VRAAVAGQRVAGCALADEIRQPRPYAGQFIAACDRRNGCDEGLSGCALAAVERSQISRVGWGRIDNAGDRY